MMPMGESLKGDDANPDELMGIISIVAEFR